MTKINLGDEVRDTITGFKGVAIARTEWITGCDRYTVSPKVDKDGKMGENQSFDGPTLVVTKAKKPIKVKTEKKGGPRETPSQGRF